MGNKPLSFQNQGQAEKILSSLISQGNKPEVMRFGRSLGFLNNLNRVNAYRLLLPTLEQRKEAGVSQSLKNQLAVDVARSFYDQKSKPVDQGILATLRNLNLQNMQSFFSRFPEYKYFQGFHEISGFFYFFCCPSDAAELGPRLAKHLLDDLLMRGFDQSLWPILQSSCKRIKEQSPTIAGKLLDFRHFPCEIPLTLFTRAARTIPECLRVWDFLVSTGKEGIPRLIAEMTVLNENLLEEVNQDNLDVFIEGMKRVTASGVPLDLVVGSCNTRIEQEELDSRVRKENQIAIGVFAAALAVSLAFKSQHLRRLIS